MSNIDDYKETQTKLKETLDILNSAGKIAKFGGWNVILSENRSYWSDEVAAIHEMPAGYAPLVDEGINFYAPEWRDKITEVFTNCAQKGIPYDEEMEIITKSGKRVWIRTTGEAVRDDKGNIYKVQGGFQDITERKKTEIELVINQERYRKAQQLGKVGNWEYNIETSMFWGSEEAKRIYGFDDHPEAFTTDQVESCIPERERVHQALEDLIGSDKPYDIIFDIITKDKGVRKTIHSIAELERSADGKPLKVTGVITDITDRTRAEKEIEKTKQYLDNIINNIGYPVFVKDEQSKFMLVNDAFCDFFTLSRDEIYGTTLANNIPPEELEVFLRIDKQVLEDGIERINEEPVTTKNGETRIISTKKTLFIDNSGNKHLIGLITDITERVKAEEAMKQKTKELQNYYDIMIDRELKMIELKEEVNELLKELGKEKKYEI